MNSKSSHYSTEMLRVFWSKPARIDVLRRGVNSILIKTGESPKFVTDNLLVLYCKENNLHASYSTIDQKTLKRFLNEDTKEIRRQTAQTGVLLACADFARTLLDGTERPDPALRHDLSDLINLAESLEGGASTEPTTSPDAHARPTPPAVQEVPSTGNADPDHLEAPSSADPRNDRFDVSGAWKGFYIESMKTLPPYVVEEDIDFIQSATRLEGRAVAVAPAQVEGRVEHFHNGWTLSTAVEVVIAANSTMAGWRRPAGCGSFIMRISEAGDWLDGFCIWYDQAIEQIEESRCIAVRRSSEMFEQLCAEARALIEKELSLRLFRQLTMNDVPLEQAASIVSQRSRQSPTTDVESD